MGLRGLTLKQGEVVTCPGCGEEIAEVVCDLYAGDVIEAACFRGFKSEIRQHSACVCPDCGESWAKSFPNFGFKIHVKEGWK